MKKIIAAIILLPIIALAGLNWFAPELIYSGAMQLTRSAAGMERYQLQLGEHQYAYLDSGIDNNQDTLPTILFIHGFGAEKDNWTRMAIPLKDQYRLVALDLLGHGESDQPDGADYRISAQAARVAAFIEAKQLQNVHLIGNSMGGHIAGMLAARHPAQIASVTFLNNGGIKSPVIADAWQAVAAGEPNPLVMRSPEDAERFFDYVMVEKPFMTGSIQEYFAERSIARQALNDDIFSHLIDDKHEDLALELPKIHVPTQIIWGENDRILHVSSIEVMKPLLKDPKVVILKETGHGPMMERPTRVADELDSFIQSL